MTPREYLFSLELHGVKLGLDKILRLLDGAGQPQGRYPTVHVAGTNGKGSVLAMLGAILEAGGYRTGRFTSPHLIDVTERFLINSQPIPPEVLDEQIVFFRELAEGMESPPTFFEMNTAIAFRWFEQCEVDIGLIEVGMGGRLDSTNVITPMVAGITNIDFEHTRHLGDTLEKIAYEKAGIIKKGVPVVVTETKPVARDVILARAVELGAPTCVLGRDFAYRLSGDPLDQEFFFESPTLTVGPVRLSLAGTFQGENAATTVALAGRLCSHYERIAKETIEAGLAGACWPCRLEKVLDRPPVIIDVAHNPAGACQLARQFSRCVVVLAVSADKHVAGMLEALAPITETLILSQFTGARALPVKSLCNAAGSYPHRPTANLTEAIELGVGLATQSLPLLITGSIFTAGEARRILVEHYGALPAVF